MPTRKVVDVLTERHTTGGDEIVPHDEPNDDENPSGALGAEGFYLVNHRTASETE